jgi:hypothetical protein
VLPPLSHGLCDAMCIDLMLDLEVAVLEEAPRVLRCRKRIIVESIPIHDDDSVSMMESTTKIDVSDGFILQMAWSCC